MRRWIKGSIVGTVTGLLGALLALTSLGADFEKTLVSNGCLRSGARLNHLPKPS